jgi:hypothetical protein
MHVSLPGHIARAPGSLQCGARRTRELVPPASPEEERFQGAEDLPAVSLEPGRGRLACGSQQHLVLGLSPSPCLRIIAGHLGDRAGLRRCQADGAQRRIKQSADRIAGMQVVIQQSVQCGSALGIIVVGAGLLGSVGAQQVMENEPAVCVFGQQVSAGEFAYRTACLVEGQASQAGSGRDSHVGAWVHTEQPEQSRSGVAQALVGPGKYGANAACWIIGVKHVQPASCVAELGDQAGEGGGRAAVGASYGDAHRERQPCAQCDQLADRLRLIRDPRAIEPPSHQLMSIRSAEQIQRKHVRA